MVIVNEIMACGPQRLRKRALEDITRIVVHRCSLAETAPEMAKAFASIPETGGMVPYHYLVMRDGTISQCLPLDVVAYHSLRYNRNSIGVALVGDFRKEAPTAEQTRSLILLSAGFMEWIVDDINGHTDLPHASSDKNKKCPGHYLDVDAIYNEAKAAAILNPADRLRQMGCILGSEECPGIDGSPLR